MSVVEHKPLWPAVGEEDDLAWDRTHPPRVAMYAGKMDREAMTIIRRCGFICREANGKLWVSTGQTISEQRFERLLKLGLLVPKGDSLFGGPSQTFIPTEASDVQRNPAAAHSP